MKTLINTAIILIIIAITATYAIAQSSTPVTMPFGIALSQSVPVSAIVAIDGVTTTIPMTVSIDLSIRVESPVSFTVQSAPAPQVTLVSGDKSIDDLDIPYSTSIDNELTLTEWTTYINSDDYFAITGEVYLDADAEDVDDVTAVVRFYDTNDKLIDVDEIVNIWYGLDPGGYNRFDSEIRLPVVRVARYTVEMAVRR